jgi:hypothetical protein
MDAWREDADGEGRRVDATDGDELRPVRDGGGDGRLLIDVCEGI